MDRCNGIFGAIFGHKYVTVITKSAPKRPLQLEGSARFALKTIDAYREQAYHGVYCKRCGKVINA